MTHAYNKNFLDDARDSLGFAFEYAVNHAGISLNKFYDMFLVSKIAAAFGDGSPKYVCGMSGTELAWNIFDRVNFNFEPTPHFCFNPTSEYWTGWILAYYQWYSGLSFESIKSFISAEEIHQMYNPLHEAPEQKFIDVMNTFIISRHKTSNLQRLRKQAELTQKQLSELSGVNLRTLQEYEIGHKDINKASGDTINALAKALCCNFYDLLEIIPS